MSQNDLSDTFELKVNGTPQQIFMSYGLLNELIKLTGSAETAALAAVDTEMRGAVLAVLIQPRNRSGKVTEAVDPAEVGLDRYEVLDLLSWAADHVAGFFVEAVTRVTATVGRHQEKLKALESFLPGSATSPGSGPSAGPSAASPAS